MFRLIRAKNQWKQRLKSLKLERIALLVALIALPASIMFYCSWVSDFINRNPEILEVKPFVYINERKDLQYKDWPAPTDLGIFFIVHLKNGAKQSAINGLKIESSKYYLDLDQYLFFFMDTPSGPSGKTLPDIEVERQEKKPYIVINWDTLFSEKNIKKDLYPNEEAYIGFTLLDPNISGQNEWGCWKSPAEKYYIGYENPPKEPEIIRGQPDFDLFFSDFNINNLPPRTIRDDFEFVITINDKDILINKEKFDFVHEVSEHQYNTDSFEKMFSRYYAE